MLHVRCQGDTQVKYRLKLPQGDQVTDDMSEPGKALVCPHLTGQKQGTERRLRQQTSNRRGEPHFTLSSFHSSL